MALETMDERVARIVEPLDDVYQLTLQLVEQAHDISSSSSDHAILDV
jgi:hypothetical protein